VLAGREARFLAPLDVRKIPGVGKVTEKNLHACGVRKVGDLAAIDESFLQEKFGKWGLALAGKSHGQDAGGWFDTEIGENEQPKSISHEHTYSEDTDDVDRLEATLARLSEMVGRRLREHHLWARTVQLKLRHTDFSTITRAHSLDHPTQLDTDLAATATALFRDNWTPGTKIRLLGVQASSFSQKAGQLSLLDSSRDERWSKALAAADRLRDRFGESSVSTARAMRGVYRERVHENPAGLPGKHPKK
jgi:DNA polymerase-4